MPIEHAIMALRLERVNRQITGLIDTHTHILYIHLGMCSSEQSRTILLDSLWLFLLFSKSNRWQQGSKENGGCPYALSIPTIVKANSTYEFLYSGPNFRSKSYNKNSIIYKIETCFLSKYENIREQKKKRWKLSKVRGPKYLAPHDSLRNCNKIFCFQNKKNKNSCCGNFSIKDS